MASHSRRAAAPDLVAHTADRIRQWILSGELAPGAPVTERQVAARLPVSRGTARAALRTLQHEGIVQSSAPGRYARFRAAPLTVAGITDLTVVMAALSAAGARVAASLDRADRERLVERLRRINGALAASIKSGEQSRAHRLDAEFHRAYVSAAGNARLEALRQGLEPELERYATAYHRAVGARSVAEHRTIIGAIERGRPREAAAASERNWLNSVDRARRSIEDAGERGII